MSATDCEGKGCDPRAGLRAQTDSSELCLQKGSNPAPLERGRDLLCLMEWHCAPMACVLPWLQCTAAVQALPCADVTSHIPGHARPAPGAVASTRAPDVVWMCTAWLCCGGRWQVLSTGIWQLCSQVTLRSAQHCNSSPWPQNLSAHDQFERPWCPSRRWRCFLHMASVVPSCLEPSDPARTKSFGW